MWTYRNPVKILFGDGSFDELPLVLDSRTYALVTYPDAAFRKLREALTEMAGAPVLVIDDVAPNPDYGRLEEQVTRLRGAAAPEAIVALGGGSVIDTAKVLATGREFAEVRHFLETGIGGSSFRTTPIVAVPTTAGTGSEVTCWGTVWDTANGRKHSLSLPGLYPETAVIDPALMQSKPRALTVSTGLDALSHALESLWNKHATPVSMTFAVSAAREILDVLPQLVDDLRNHELRTRMAKAALFAGLAFSSTKTAIAHAISYPVTLYHNVPHGIACSFTLPMVMRSVEGVEGLCGRGLRAIFEMPVIEAADCLEKILHGLGVSTEPAAYGIAEEEWQELVAAAFSGERGQNFIAPRDALVAVMSGKPARVPLSAG